MDPMVEGGLPPRKLRREELNLPIDYIFYSNIFKTIKAEKIDKLNIKNLSPESIEMLHMYFDRFLIERENQEI